jgi:hypothetical protein
MPLTEIDPIEGALELLKRGETHAAHLLLADVFAKDTTRTDLARIANLIAPCQMFDEAEDALMRAKFQSVIDPVAAYRANPPADEDIGAAVKIQCLAGA